jgi:hypothetical protein
MKRLRGPGDVDDGGDIAETMGETQRPVSRQPVQHMAVVEQRLSDQCAPVRQSADEVIAKGRSDSESLEVEATDTLNELKQAATL